MDLEENKTQPLISPGGSQEGSWVTQPRPARPLPSCVQRCPSQAILWAVSFTVVYSFFKKTHFKSASPLFLRGISGNISQGVSVLGKPTLTCRRGTVLASWRALPL